MWSTGVYQHSTIQRSLSFLYVFVFRKLHVTSVGYQVTGTNKYTFNILFPNFVSYHHRTGVREWDEDYRGQRIDLSRIRIRTTGRDELSKEVYVFLGLK